MIALIRITALSLLVAWTISLCESFLQYHVLTQSRKSSSLYATRAADLMTQLVEEMRCYTDEAGARDFVLYCAPNIVIEDRFNPQPVVGRADVAIYLQDRASKHPGEIRIDLMSDGDKACGFAWTWTCGNEEGLRGTTFVELNDQGEIVYMQEIPEPLFKPGNATRDLLKAITEGAEPKEAVPFTPQTPTTASEIAKYLYVDLQYADPQDGAAELMRFLDDNIIYRDFNFKEPLTSPQEVRSFVDDFSFPGIEFRPLKFDDGQLVSCFTWEVVLADAPDTVKGMSLYQIDAKTRKIVYVRDVPESAIKPPILGKLARDLRPGLGVFQGVPLGSRPEGK